MKKKIAFMMVLMMFSFSTTIMTLFVSTAIAEPTASPDPLVYLDPSTITAEVGHTFDVNIMVSNVQNLGAWQAGVQWDPSILEYVSHTWGEIQQYPPYTPSVRGDPIIDSVAGRTSLPALESVLDKWVVSATQVRLLTITFRAISVGASPLSLIDVSLKGRDLTSTTSYSRWSDVNGDGKVDLRDVVITLKRWSISSYDLTSDFNDDGIVDITDIAIVSGDFGKFDLHPEWSVTNPIFDIPVTLQHGSVTTTPDTTPPITTISLLGTSGVPPWYTSDVTVTLTATDPAGIVAETDYSFDGLNWAIYTAPFVITTEGTKTVYYYSVDNVGNIEPTKSETVYIDKTAPTITITSPQPTDYLQNQILTLDFSAIDTGSGVSSLEGSLSLDPATIYIDPQYSTASVGQPFSIDMRITDAVDVYGWQIRLKWNPMILDVVSVTEGNFLRSGGGNTIWPAPYINQAEGWVFFGCALMAPSDPVSGSGTLATVTFVGTGEGSGTLEIMTDYPYRTKLIDRDANPIPFSTSNGYFSVVQAPPVHDIAIISVTVSPTQAMAGDTVAITVDVKNEGTYYETFDVTVSYDSTLIATQTGVSLSSWATTSLTFTWDTTGVPMGVYTIKAEASVVIGESDTFDNTFIDGPVLLGTRVTSGQQIDLSTFQPGKYTLVVTAVDAAGNQAVAMVTFNVINTPTGTNVVVPVPSADLTLTFNSVTGSGTTEATTSDTGPNPPTGFQLGAPPLYYEITTTATYTGPIQISITYDETRFTNEANLRLLQWDVGTSTWLNVTLSLDTTNNIIYGQVSHLSMFAVMQPITGSVSGTATDEYTKQPIQGITISILETGDSTTTDAHGSFSFPMLSPGIYTLEMTVNYGYLTHDAITKFVQVLPGQNTIVSFTLYQAAWSGATVPRTIGYWKNWDNHYTRTIMENLVTYVKASSGLFSSLTVDNLKSYLTLTRFSTMQQRGEVQLLASWLNVVSAQLGVDVQVDITSIAGWQTVINDADGILSVNDLLKQIDNCYLTDTALTKEQWEIIKNILDALNNRQLFTT
jgi:hypothetical protein